KREMAPGMGWDTDSNSAPTGRGTGPGSCLPALLRSGGPFAGGLGSPNQRIIPAAALDHTERYPPPVIRGRVVGDREGSGVGPVPSDRLNSAAQPVIVGIIERPRDGRRSAPEFDPSRISGPVGTSRQRKRRR